MDLDCVSFPPSSTRSVASRWLANATARSRATQHMSLEYRKSLRFAPDLPDALILFLPPPGGGVGELYEELSGPRCGDQELCPTFQGQTEGPTSRRGGVEDMI